jgi:putative oxidoreductase
MMSRWAMALWPGSRENIMSDFAYALGRVLTTILFIIAGAQKFINVAGILNSQGVKNFMALFGGGAAPTWLGYLIAAIELFAGLLVLVGYKTRTAALVLAVFTLVATIFGHNWWAMEGAARMANFVQANKNLAIMGAFLIIAVIGAGRYSVDNWNSSTKS